MIDKWLYLKYKYCSAANISRTQAREALLEFVAENCCFGKEAAQKMQMNRVVPSNAMHVSLVLMSK